MAAGTIALVMLVVGAGLLVSVDRVKKPIVKASFVRLAAVAFIAAGLALTSGWVADASGWTVDTVNDLGTAALNEGFGTGAVWVLWGALAVTWFAAMIPESWFSFQMPDWLSISGLILPAATSGLPGDLGQGLHDVMVRLGSVMTQFVVERLS
jgi:hypothetical protein